MTILNSTHKLFYGVQAHYGCRSLALSSNHGLFRASIALILETGSGTNNLLTKSIPSLLIWEFSKIPVGKSRSPRQYWYNRSTSVSRDRPANGESSSESKEESSLSRNGVSVVMISWTRQPRDHISTAPVYKDCVLYRRGRSPKFSGAI